MGTFVVLAVYSLGRALSDLRRDEQSPDELGSTRGVTVKHMPDRPRARGMFPPTSVLAHIEAQSQAASHSKKGWETFTTAVLKTIVDRLAPTGAEQGAKGVVFLAWGKPAERLCAGISEVRVLSLIHI